MKREEYRSQLARRSQRRLQVCLLLALLGHIGAIGIVGRKSFFWFTKPDMAVIPVEFVDLAPVDLDAPDVDKTEPEAKTIAPVDWVAGGVHQANLPIGAGEENTQTVSFASNTRVQSSQTQTSPEPLASTSASTSASMPEAQTVLSKTAAQVEQWVTQALPAPLGASLDRLLNPNRTHFRSPGRDAKRDRIWSGYDAALQRKIRDHWRSIQVTQSCRVKVRLILNQQGQLKDLKILQASGEAEADAVALDAVRSAAPFAHFPAEATQDSLQVDFTFEYFAATN